MGLINVPGNIKDIITFALAGNIMVGDGLTNMRPLPYKGNIRKYQVKTITAPTGANAIFEVNIHNGTTGAVKSTITITLTAGQTKKALTVLTPYSFEIDDYLTLDCTQIGSSVVGADVTIVLTTEAA
jgi:hypothetical protein